VSYVTPQNEWVTSIHNRLIVWRWISSSSIVTQNAFSASYYESIVNWSDSFILRSDVTHSRRDSECILRSDVTHFIMRTQKESRHSSECSESEWSEKRLTWRIDILMSHFRNDWRDSFCGLRRDVTHSGWRLDAFWRVTWPRLECGMTHSEVWHESVCSVTWLIVWRCMTMLNGEMTYFK